MDNPNIDHVGVMKMLSSEWKQMDSVKINNFQILAEKDKLRYDSDCRDFMKAYEQMKRDNNV